MKPSLCVSPKVISGLLLQQNPFVLIGDFVADRYLTTFFGLTNDHVYIPVFYTHWTQKTYMLPYSDFESVFSYLNLLKPATN